MLPRF
jgi:hypothetical protein